MSGSQNDRPGLKECLGYLEPCDSLVVGKLDRFSRLLSHLLAIVTELQDRGIGFGSPTEGMDTTTAQGKLLFVSGVLGPFRP
jgi:DNA invertase Pin-like site-specific DNA recombinase